MRYYVNKIAQPNGDHEVHKAVGCPTPASLLNQQDLGDFTNCREAVTEAKNFYATADGCANCSPECHTS